MDASIAAAILTLTCLCFCAVSWGIAGIAFARKAWKEASSLTDSDDADDDAEQDNSPYGIDPDYDPADWWKREQKETSERVAK